MRVGKIVLAENLRYLRTLPDACVDLIYIDPPFGVNKKRAHTHVSTDQDKRGDRVGFGGKRYKTTKGQTLWFDDSFADYLKFISPRLREARRILKKHGSIFVHVDHHQAHYVRIKLDELFGPACYKNEIIWAYDFGGRSKTRWPAKHDTIFWYSKDPDTYTFNRAAIDRIPYMAPGLAGEEKAKLGKVPTDVWWMTIVPTNSRERTGYPTQKPLKLLKRIVAVHSNKGDIVLDFFCGTGTTGEAAAKLGRKFILVDSNQAAIKICRKRIGDFKAIGLPE